MLLSEQEIVRIKKIKYIKNLGIECYPSDRYIINTTIKDIIINYKENKQVSLAGRLFNMRIMGKSAFADIKDHTGTIQLYFTIDNNKNQYDIYIKKILDIGDIIGVKGLLFITKTGEITIKVKQITLLSKSLRTIPQVKIDEYGNIHDLFSNTELRYRMRYVDLIVNEKTKNIFLQRSKIIQVIRTLLNSYNFLEVETPILQPIVGGANARPFITYHNTFKTKLYLRISNELYLKRLIIGGFKGVYEFSKDFRNEGMDRMHNPEFTILELYVAYKDYYWMMEFVELLLLKLCIKLYNKTKINLDGQVIDFNKKFHKITIYDAIKNNIGIYIYKMSEKDINKICLEIGIKLENNMGIGKMIDKIFSERCQKHYIEPTFIIDYPIDISPLAKNHRNKNEVTERFELIINGKEIANAYSELNDPIEQLDRFKKQYLLYKKGDQESMFIDNDFIRALEFGMPPTAGIGIGIDRLVMLFTSNKSIQEVLLFPQMKN